MYGLEPGHVHVRLRGSAGQSLGAFGVQGLKLEVFGDANDYVGKGLSGATIVVRPTVSSQLATQDNTIIGNSAGIGSKGNLNQISGKGAGVQMQGDYNIVSGTESGALAVGNNNVFQGTGTGAVSQGNNNVFTGRFCCLRCHCIGSALPLAGLGCAVGLAANTLSQ